MTLMFLSGYSLSDDAGHPTVIGWRATAAAAADNNASR
jgi:hypothetical protein